VKDVEEMVHADDKGMVHDALINFLENKTGYDIEYRIITVDTGEERIVNSKATPSYDEKGNPVKILGVIRDVTAYKKAQAELVARDARYDSMISNISDIIGILDGKGTIIYKSPNIKKWFGWDPEDLVNKDAFITVHPDDQTYIKGELEELLKQPRKSKTVNYRYMCKDESYRHIELTAKNLLDDPNINGILLNYHDITEQKQLEEEKMMREALQTQQQRLESVGTLAGGVAHEINNPINGIMNYAQLIIDNADKESDSGDYAKEIVHESERIAAIVSNLLQFSRQEKQSHSYADIETIIDKTLSLINTVMRRDQIDLQIDIPKGLPDIKCRSQQIQQVIMNLLTNARDALNDKYPGYHENKIIKLHCEQFNKQNRNWLRLTVEDHGAGIPVSVQEKLFDPFFTTKERDKGTGLGLPISYGIVKEHHGELTFETEEGSFTRFYLELPCDNGWDIEDNQQETE